MIEIGNSGFGYISESVRTGASSTRGKNYYIKNLKTNKISFTLYTLIHVDVNRPPIDAEKTFLGIDNQYYHIMCGYNEVLWGRVTSDGAVININGVIIKTINFYPQYQISVLKSEPKIPNTPPIDVTPKVVTLSPKIKVPDTPPVEEISWLKKLIKQIKQWIKKILTL